MKIKNNISSEFMLSYVEVLELVSYIVSMSKFEVLEFSIIHTKKNYYNMLKPDVQDIESHYIYCDSIFPSFEATDKMKDLREKKNIFDISNLNENMNCSQG